MNTISSYPLQWPDGVGRTLSGQRKSSPFRTGYKQAVENVAGSLRLFQRDAGVKISHVVLSTNVDLLSNRPADPGAAAWFQMDNQWVAFGVDRFYDVAANVQAIHHIIEARRTELKYGGLAIVRQTFRAFIALPAPSRRSPWEILGIHDRSTPEVIETAFRAQARRAHPDAGGSNAAMAELNAARDEAIRLAASRRN